MTRRAGRQRDGHVPQKRLTRTVVTTALILILLPQVNAATGKTAPPTAYAHLQRIEALSPSPEYRRFGSADNGGGTAAILRAAQLLSTNRPDIGVVVGLFDGEEVGLFGSHAVASALARPAGVSLGSCLPPLHLADIVADINLDAPSARAKDVAGGTLPVFSWRAMVFSEEGALASTSISVFMSHGVAGLPINARAATVANGGMDRTDARWFDAAGIPVTWPVAGYAQYHTDGDTLAVIDPADLEAVAQVSADLIGRIATIPVGRVAGAPPPPPEAPFTPCPRPKARSSS